jgi:transposase InsO family protein
MSELRDRRAEDVALFRYGLIAELMHPQCVEDAERKQTLEQRLRDKAAGTYCIPHSRRTRVGIGTLRDWIKLYEQGGFDALRPKPRTDAGHSRAIAQPVADLLVHIKDEHRDWSVAMVIDEAKKSSEQAHKMPLPPSTVHRLLSRAGLMKKAAGAPSGKDKRRFSFEHAGELWMSDVMHGPAVWLPSRRKRKTYLIGFLDDATRVVPYAAFCLAENTAAFLPVFAQAIRRRGLPLRLYVDNGAVYRSRHLALVCAKLGVTLIHSRPHQPAGRGKQERFFRTVRMKLLSTLTDADVASLEALNRRLWAWIEGEYHHCPHRGLDSQTPLDAWAMRSENVRIPGPQLDLREVFLFEQKRRVQKDRTVSLDGRLYELDAVLVGQTVTLRYDPARRGQPIDVWHDGKKVQTARIVDAYANCFVKRNRDRASIETNDQPPPPQAGLPMRDLGDHGKGGR